MKRLIFAVIFTMTFLSCEGQIKVDDNNVFTFEKDTVEVNVPVPYEVIVHDTVLRNYTEDEKLFLINTYHLTDTIYRSSDVFNLDYTNALQQPTQEPEYYIMVRGEGIVKMEMDSTQIWHGQKDLKIQRTKTFSGTYYKLIN